jgi:hypothetical protein
MIPVNQGTFRAIAGLPLFAGLLRKAPTASTDDLRTGVAGVRGVSPTDNADRFTASYGIQQKPVSITVTDSGVRVTCDDSGGEEHWQDTLQKALRGLITGAGPLSR